ncbi:hypothetical protein BDP27DRAFT_1331196 [Rhodocollybia butyracea]|uniref:Uncharacterized protein n=1 Tax=Rhodocollybia butyracea TaxID=206335 RepID=A0A9P5U4Y5_9AGAR|nr:hypothetical protein BDP27DRAFT_1331196 [Rhodocollybia butyracea]
MGQYWTLVNIDKAQVASEHWGKLGEFFWSSHSKVLDRLSTAVNLSEWPKLMSKDKCSPAAQTASFLTKLPVELLQAIAKSLIGDFADLMSFSLTCLTMWEVAEGVRFLYLRTELQRRSWNGNRIILLGDYTRRLPQKLLTEEDREMLKEKAEIYDEEGSDDGSDNGFGDADVSLLNRASHEMEENYLHYGDGVRNRIYGLAYYRYVVPEAREWFYLDISRMTLRHAPSTTEAEDRWMLRNLTKQEFVIKSKGTTPSALAQALFSLISWSDDPSISMCCDDADAGRMVRGPWAGDRIDVTLYSLHEHKNDPDWKDITKDVLVFLGRLAKGDDEGFLVDEF